MVHLDDLRMWVSVKTFHFTTDLIDHELLTALIREVQFSDPYDGGGAVHRGRLSEHGPYLLRFIEVASFDTIPSDDAEQALLSWADSAVGWHDEPLPASPEAHAALRFRVLPLLHVKPLYQLPDLGPEARRPNAAVGWKGFLEFVAVNRSRHTVTLIVASDD
jgi:hypothetical protein